MVGWKVGSQGGGVVVPRVRDDDGLALGSGYRMQRHGWITYEYLEKGDWSGSLQAYDMGTADFGALSGKWLGSWREQGSGAGLGQT